MKNIYGLVAVAATLFIISCGGSSDSGSDTESTKEASNAGTTTVNGVEIKIIPGLTAVDVHGSMEKIGFETQKNIGADISTWISQKSDENGDYKVTVTGNGPEKITSVDANYSKTSNPNLEIATQFMQFVSSLPYTGANPETAKAWVSDHAKKGGDTLISGVKFRITARENTSRSLYINVPD